MIRSYIQEFKHVIFDFDGVIIDSENKKFKDLQETLKKYGFILKEEKFKNFVGKKRAFFLKQQNNALINKNLVNIMNEIHQKDFQLEQYKLINGLIDFLDFLNHHDIKMHIATGSSERFVLKILKQFNIQHYFTHIITGDQVSESKPSPKIYLEMKNRINNESACVIEDSRAGILSAKKARFFVISFIEDKESDLYVVDYLELLNKPIK